MPNAGWLQAGLWLRSKSDPEKWFRVNSLESMELFGIVELQGPHPSNEAYPVFAKNLHDCYLSPSYFECDDCQRKPGSPTLCNDCLKRRTEFYRSGERHCELPRFCSIPFPEYGECWLPMGRPTYVPPVRLPRYKRPWVI